MIFGKYVSANLTSFLDFAAAKSYRDRVSLFGMIFASLYTVIYIVLIVYMFDSHSLPLTTHSLTLAGMIASLFMLNFRHFVIAKVAFTLVLFYNIYASTFIFSSHSGYQNFFIALPVFIFGMFEFHRKSERIWAIILIPMSMFSVVWLHITAEEALIVIPEYKFAAFTIIIIISVSLSMIIGLSLLGHEMYSAEKRLNYFASTDPLTEAINRRKFYAESKAEIDRTIRYRNNLSLLVIDIDKFKGINDAFGHTTGDNALKALATVCRNSIRTTDHFSRIGGDEFAILLVETDERKARLTAERIRESVEAIRLNTKGGKVRFTTSIGIACFSESITNIEEFIQQADMRMYAAKRAGGNRLEVSSA